LQPIQARELIQQFLRGRIDGIKVLDQYETACKVRRLAPRTIPTYKRWVEEFLRFHHGRSGRWIHPKDMSEPDVEAFLTHTLKRQTLARRNLNTSLKRQLRTLK
jgi:site-specific recombinase XerD